MPRLSSTPIIDNNIHELITAVDPQDKSPTYPIDKLKAHIEDIPHAAVSIFVFDGPRLLLQKRAETKYHSGGLWANTVCSHPRWDESADACAARRLKDELGWSVPLSPFGEISYQAQVGNLYENEHVYLFHGHIDDSIDVEKYNTDEVCAVQWSTLPDIMDSIRRRPNTFSEWFKIYMSQHRQMFDELVCKPIV